MDPLLQFLLVLTIILAVAKGAGSLSARLGQPAVLGELLAGVLLGPSLLNMMHWPLFDGLRLEETISQLAHLGVIFLMFLAGLEVDLETMITSGRAAMLAGLLGVAAPVALGAAVAALFGFGASAALFIGLVLAATSVSISAQTLMELGVLRSRVGMALLGAAVVDDIVVIFLLSVFTAVVLAGNQSPLAMLWIVLRMSAFLVLAVVLGNKLIPRLANRAGRMPISQAVVSMAIIVTLLLSWAAEALGSVAAITGAFLAGLLFARTSARQEIADGFHTIAYAFVVPIFFVNIGLETNARLLGSGTLPFALALAAVAILSKVLGCGLGARLSGFSNRDSLRMGVGMISRGEVGLIAATVGLNAELIGQDVFAAVVIIVLLTTLITPILLRMLYPRPTPTH
ncbi:MAG: cation:proton antiporter [Chloroflexi bacterium]|nr:cation:proton antiporter [Chloroflexota bacterium]